MAERRVVRDEGTDADRPAETSSAVRFQCGNAVFTLDDDNEPQQEPTQLSERQARTVTGGSTDERFELALSQVEQLSENFKRAEQSAVEAQQKLCRAENDLAETLENRTENQQKNPPSYWGPETKTDKTATWSKGPAVTSNRYPGFPVMCEAPTAPMLESAAADFAGSVIPVARMRGRPNEITVPGEFFMQTLAATRSISDAVVAPKPFTGRAGDEAENWLEYFDRYCNFRRLNDDNRAELFRILMHGAAADWLMSLTGTAQMAYAQL
ncbi:MAG TPA: hypothetical protein VLS45_10585 [Methylomicrobium sp.]|nr:hypothetical protein [Methylomicrobium sp.]